MPETQSTTKSTGTGNGADHRGLGERVDQISQDAQQLWSDAQGAVNQLGAKLDIARRVERHPYGMLLAAAGVGYVLGGGLFSRLTARMVRLGIRLAALPFVKEELLNVARNVLRPQEAGDGSAPPQAAPPAEPPEKV